MAVDGTDNLSLEYTSTWVVALVCSVIVIISLCMERLIHWLGKCLKHKNQGALFDALQKLKEELMMLGFISFLLTVFQNLISHFCIPTSVSMRMLPCNRPVDQTSVQEIHYQETFSLGILGTGRRLMSHGTDSGHCSKRGKAPLLSIEALHQLHIFIFVLAVVHVVFCAITMILGVAKIRQWKHWEDSIKGENLKKAQAKESHTPANLQDFLRAHAVGFWARSAILSWVASFFKQFFHSVSKFDYLALRHGFIMIHCPSNLDFDFHKYMMRVLEADFKKVVGIRWYLWLFVIVFLLLNVEGWHTYFWLSFLPLILLLAVGAKLEQIITQLAQDVAEKQRVEHGEQTQVVSPSDEHFWFRRPGLVLYLIHFILFQNSFEIAFFFWIWCTYGFDSCIIDKVGYIIPRLVIGVIIQVLCSYSTLPLYAIVTQMGSMFKPVIFQEHLSKSLHNWAQGAKNKMKSEIGSSVIRKIFGRGKSKDDPSVLEMQKMEIEAHGDAQSVILEGITTTISEPADSNN